MQLHHRCDSGDSDHILHAVLLALIHLFGVLAKQRSPRLLVQEDVAGLAEQHKAALVEVLVVSLVLVVDIEELRPLVLLAAELACLVSAGEHVLAEHLPSWSGTEVLVLFLQCIVILFSIHILNVAICVVYSLHKLLHYCIKEYYL